MFATFIGGSKYNEQYHKSKPDYSSYKKSYLFRQYYK